MVKENKREIVIPGEIIASGDDYLPGEGTEKRGEDIVALKYGLSEESAGLVRIIPLSGTYVPRKGNLIIGKVEMITFNGWVLDMGTPANGFISLMEVPRFVNKDFMEEVMDIGDLIVAKIYNVSKRGIDLTLKLKGLGKIEEGLIVEINPNKVPRVIGKEGSMITIIKNNTNCNITVGQNGAIWINGDNIESELLAKRAIEFISDKSSSSGLTEEVTKWFEENKN